MYGTGAVTLPLIDVASFGVAPMPDSCDGWTVSLNRRRPASIFRLFSNEYSAPAMAPSRLPFVTRSSE